MRIKMNHLFQRLICCLVVAIYMMGANEADAREYFVSPDGSDAAQGTMEHPFATIQKASSVLRPGDVCLIREGIYREVLRPAVSGEPGNVITYSAYKDEQVIISGSELVSDWNNEGNGIYSASMPWTLSDGNQIFVNGIMQSEACWPNAGDEHLFKPERATASGGTKNTLICSKIPGPKDAWKGAQLWCAGGSAWVCWTSEVTGYDPATHTLTFDRARDQWYTPREGNLFVLRGVRFALDAPGEWFYDSSRQRLFIIPRKNTDIKTTRIEAKRRNDAIDLSGRSYVNIDGIDFIAAGIRTDKESSHIVLRDLKGSYVSHSYRNDVGDTQGVIIAGNNNLLLSCDLGYSSASVLTVKGQDNRIINCNIHHGGYAGLLRGTVGLSGRRIVFSHNTVRHAGRDLINTYGLMESLVQYNDVSDAGWLTSDLGMFYGHNTDFANTVFRYNFVHDNHAKSASMGIYFDHLSHNAIVHHNIIWNVGMDPIRFNNPSYCNLVFNNTSWQTGAIGTYDHSNRNDLFGTRFFKNIFNDAINLPEHVVQENNLISGNPPFRSAKTGDFRLRDGFSNNIGALDSNKEPWRAGCNLQHPPDPLPVYETPRIAWMNLVQNACFEFGSLEGWMKTDSSKAELVEGNNWGNAWGSGREQHGTGTSQYELQLGPGKDGLEQTVTGLTPNTKYQLSAWMRVSSSDETIVLGVKDAGTEPVSISLSATEWTRMSIDFTTGPESTTTTIYLIKSSGGQGSAWADNVSLLLTPSH